MASSAVVKVRPELIVPVDSGPSSPLAMSTPVTVKLLVLKLDVPPPVNPPPPRAAAATASRRRRRSPVPPLVLKAGTVPVTVRSVSVSPPAAAATLATLEIVVTAEELIEASVKSAVSVLSLILLPAAGRLLVPVLCRKLNPNPPCPLARRSVPWSR